MCEKFGSRTFFTYIYSIKIRDMKNLIGILVTGLGVASLFVIAMGNFMLGVLMMLPLFLMAQK